MNPDQFVMEYWKAYDSYIERKERRIEVTTTLYLGFVSALLLRDEWLRYIGLVFLLWLGTTALVLMFVMWQLSLHSSAARIANSCQTLMTQWLTKTPTAADLTAEP